MEKQAKYVVKENKNLFGDHFHFNLVAPNGEIIFSSTHTYPTLNLAKEDIAKCQALAPMLENYRTREDKNNNPYFLLTEGPYGEARLLMKSETYETKPGRLQGMETCAKHGGTLNLQVISFKL